MPEGSLDELLAVHGDEVVAVGASKGAAHLVGLRRGHAGHVLDELHHLLLPYYDAATPLQGALLQGMVVLPLCAVPVPLHELGDGAALDSHAGADEGHLIGQVQQIAGAEPLGHLQLGGGLEQKNSLGPALVDHVIDVGVLRVYPAQVWSLPFPLLDEV